MTRRFSSFAAVALTLLPAAAPLLTPSAAWAQEQAAAEALFRSAREAAARGDWVTACDRFEESNRLETTPGSVFNLAKCREELGQLASAWKRYGEVVQRLPGNDARVAYAKERLAALEGRVPHLTLRAPEGAPPLVVTLSGMRIASATLGVAIPVDPGAVALRVEAKGHAAREKQLTISIGDQLTETLELGPVQTEEPALDEPAAAKSETSSSRTTWGIVSLGAGAVGVGFAVAGFVWASNESQITSDPDHCVPGGSTCDQVGYDASQRGQMAAVMGWAGVGLGVVGAGLGTFLLTTGSGDSVSIGIRPVIGGASLSVGGQL